MKEVRVAVPDDVWLKLKNLALEMGISDDELGGSPLLPLDRYGITLRSVASGDDTVSLDKVAGGTLSNLVPATAPFAGFNAFEWHTYALHVDFDSPNDTLSILVDGSPVPGFFKPKNIFWIPACVGMTVCRVRRAHHRQL